jgi:hypothetical protein
MWKELEEKLEKDVKDLTDYWLRWARAFLNCGGVICMEEKEAEKRRVRLEIIVAMLNDDPLLRDQLKVYLA